MTIAAWQLAEWIEQNYPEAPISRFACRNTASGAISQHSAYGSPRQPGQTKDHSNALDVFGPGKTTGASDQAYVQAIVDAIRADGITKWSIRRIIWRDGGAHENHAHIDFYPMIRERMWCGKSWVPSWRYSDGSVIATRDPEPENGRYDGGEAPAPPPGSEAEVYLPLVYSDGFNSSPARREDVTWLQLALDRAGLAPGDVDGKYGQDTADAVAQLFGDDGRSYEARHHDKLLQLAYAGGAGPGFVPHSHELSSGEPV